MDFCNGRLKAGASFWTKKSGVQISSPRPTYCIIRYFLALIGIGTPLAAIEELTGSLMIGLPLVCAGIFPVNWRRRAVV